MNRSARIKGLAATALVAALLGCTPRAGGRIEAPSLSPSDAAAQALATYDTNKDGLLDAKELEKCPALLGALDELDKNKDKKLSPDEITAALQEMRDSKIGILSVDCQLLLDGRPLRGATVRLVPEAFLGSSFKPAEGLSQDDGNVMFRTAGYDVDGVPCGFYRIEVSKKDPSGRELLPSRYNSATTLGWMISPVMRGGLHLKLTSR
jgi:hypothetical protein